MLWASSWMANCFVVSISFWLGSLSLHNSTYFFCRSNPTAFLSRSWDATRVVPLPTNGSRTSSPLWVNSSIIFFEREIGKVAGCKVLSRMSLFSYANCHTPS